MRSKDVVVAGADIDVAMAERRLEMLPAIVITGIVRLPNVPIIECWLAIKSIWMVIFIGQVEFVRMVGPFRTVSIGWEIAIRLVVKTVFTVTIAWVIAVGLIVRTAIVVISIHRNPSAIGPATAVLRDRCDARVDDRCKRSAKRRSLGLMSGQERTR